MVVHKAGVNVNTLTTQNIVFDNLIEPTRAFVINFDSSTLHDCQAGKVVMNAVAPLSAKFGCIELYEACDTWGNIWAPRKSSCS